ncbi:MAG: RNA polymerase sigma factor [Clostridia bacterium]|nr:RNA polymerase sigma factor [Clostridia bacterium]
MKPTVKYREQTDETLVALTLMRDEAAFEELVIRHRKAALLVAHTVTRNTYTAEDAVQDAFLCAWQRLDTLKDPAKFGGWVCRIAKYRAVNLAKRYRDYVPFDEAENFVGGTAEDITGYYNDQAEKELLLHCVDKLSEKIGTVIRLHYFEGLSVSDIAKRMRLAEGTVKSRLSAGREQIRKELGYMDQSKPNETLVEAVMRRVEEFLEWRRKNSKVGFEEDYKDVLSRVEELPDSEKKFYAMADVLKLGYWYLSDGKTDEMRQKLKEAAIKGNNKEVLAMCIGFDTDKYSGKEKVEYVYNTVIPELEKYGATEGVAYQHYWLGFDYYNTKDYDSARKEFELAMETGAENPLYTALAKSSLGVMDGLGDALRDNTPFQMSTTAEELVIEGDKLYYIQQPGFSRGTLDLPGYVYNVYAPLYYASRMDHLIFDETMEAGDTVTDSEGKITLTCVSKDATVVTPCGEFRGCAEMHIHNSPDRRYLPAPIFVAWYKRNIGLVAFGWKQTEGEVFGKTLLKSYTLAGGLGIIPLCAGNVWEYTTEGVEFEQVNRVEVTAVAGDKAYLSYCFYIKGNPFNEQSWADNMIYARYNYIEGDVPVDVSAYHDRAEALAVTPWEKLMVKVSKSVMERIYHGDPDADATYPQKGCWNFFVQAAIKEEGSRVIFHDDRRYSFEGKDMRDGRAQPLLHNFVYEILQNNLGAIWDDAWLTYADKEEEFQHHRSATGNDGEEFIGYAKVRRGVTVETTLGTFENCLHLRVRTSQNDGPGWAYMSSDKDYYFAPGIGLVRIVTYITSYEDYRIYDLTAYKGEGEGYMPIREGMERHYTYVNGTPDVHGGVSYYYIRNNDGELVLLADQVGMVER